MHALIVQPVYQRGDHMLLPDHLGKGFRAPFAREGLVTHRINLRA